MTLGVEKTNLMRKPCLMLLVEKWKQFGISTKK